MCHFEDASVRNHLRSLIPLCGIRDDNLLVNFNIVIFLHSVKLLARRTQKYVPLISRQHLFLPHNFQDFFSSSIFIFNLVNENILCPTVFFSHIEIEFSFQPIFAFFHNNYIIRQPNFSHQKCETFS